MTKVYVVIGPTASGKSDRAVEIALAENGEVISADSRQVYRGLNIGSGKITRREMRGVPHHMLDVASPKKVFTAHDFAQMARPIVEDILARGKTPIICGGTGFYIDALLGRVTLPNVPANLKLRATLRKKTAPQLFAQLSKLDSRRAREIDRHNPVRLIRAIEIAKALGKVPKNKPKPFPHEIIWVRMQPDKATLHERIHRRLLARMKIGMLAEVKKLHARGLSYKRMEALGLEYRHLARYLQKKVSKKQMLEELENDIVHYAKRQETYWNAVT
jgi:tRNA dimethylallyltransferase